ncbi:hypothetical protein HHK36_032629 [Tetracentron sinense]|uniref:Uncharacterized protein n=1 Tax=Tetracentron sinense TaxID=13715 RepID=A0A835CZC7_TETSI|nr:hypothetical protein HHK36_032629 [Tetracentron sinense]
MNSNFGKPNNPQRGSVPLNNFDFDFGLGNNRPRSLNDQKQQTSPYSFPSSSTQSKPVSSSWAPNKPSWTHQPAPSQATGSALSNPPTSMVGDILGKNWASTTSSGSYAGLGIAKNNPNLFEDLVGSALGQSKSNSNVPLKNAAPASARARAPAPAPTKNSYSMRNLADSLPKTNNSMRNSKQESYENLGSYSSINNNNNNRTGNLGGPSMRSGAGGGAVASSKDPFGSLLNFGSKPAVNVNATASNSNNSGDSSFGAFQNASKSGMASFPSNSFPTINNSSVGSSSSAGPKIDNFEIPTNDFATQNQPPPHSSSVDPLEMLFASTPASASTAPTASKGAGSEPFSEVDDWGLGSEFGGNDAGSTTELEGLPPPPAGVSASAAKNKGMDNHKQGQFADAIKWLSWAVVLLEKAGDNAGTMEVLLCRASCYKEVGEYKKAVADCTKVLEHDSTNVSVLVQRALLYESTEKYKLGAEDLRTVLKIDPGNRLARSTIHRLAKLAD